MNDRAIVTDIHRVIYVGEEEYPETRTDFGSHLLHNELVMKLGGEHTMYLGDGVYHLTAGTVYLMPKGDYGHYHVERMARSSCIDIFFDTDVPISDMVYTMQAADNKKLEALFQSAFSVWVAQNEGYRYETMGLLYRILSEMSRREYVSADQLSRIRPAVEYIHTHFLTMEEPCEQLAQLCGISYSYLKRLFVFQYGLAPKPYILRLKLRYACDLLRTRMYSVSRIAEMSGFSDVYYFSRTFKRHIGVTPSEFGEKYRSSK